MDNAGCGTHLPVGRGVGCLPGNKSIPALPCFDPRRCLQDTKRCPDRITGRASATTGVATPGAAAEASPAHPDPLWVRHWASRGRIGGWCRRARPRLREHNNPENTRTSECGGLAASEMEQPNMEARRARGKLREAGGPGTAAVRVAADDGLCSGE